MRMASRMRPERRGKQRPGANGQAIRGDAYWVASTATPTVDASVIQAGRLYKYISGSWQVYYEPYTYPHPLRS